MWVSKLTIIGLDNGLSPHRRESIIWTNAEILMTRTPGTKLQWNLKRNWYIFIQENAFENVVCEMAAIFSQPQCVSQLAHLSVSELNHHLFMKLHDDVIKWKHFPRNWPFVRGIPRSPVNYPHKGQWRGALMFSLICVWISGWVNNREAGDLRRYLAHYDVIVMAPHHDQKQ